MDPGSTTNYTLKTLRTNAIQLKSIDVVGKKDLPIKSQQLEMELALQPSQNVISGVRLAVGKQNVFIVGYNASSRKLFIDRSGCTNSTFNKNFADLSHYETSLTTVNKKIKLNIFFDHSIIEVFANDGEVVMTAQLFPDEEDNEIELFSTGGITKFESIKLWNMKPCWK